MEALTVFGACLLCSVHCGCALWLALNLCRWLVRKLGWGQPLAAKNKQWSVVMVLKNPLVAARLFNRATYWRSRVLCDADGSVFVPPSVANIWCAECIAMLTIMFPQMFTVEYAQKLEEDLVLKPEKLELAHDCPCCEGSDVSVLVCHLRRIRDLLQKRAGKGTAAGPSCEGKARFRPQSGSQDDFVAVGAGSEDVRREYVEYMTQVLEAHWDTDYDPNGPNSWADMMDYYDSLEAVADAQRRLAEIEREQNEATSSNRRLESESRINKLLCSQANVFAELKEEERSTFFSLQRRELQERCAAEAKDLFEAGKKPLLGWKSQMLSIHLESPSRVVVSDDSAHFLVEDKALANYQEQRLAESLAAIAEHDAVTARAVADNVTGRRKRRVVGPKPIPPGVESQQRSSVATLAGSNSAYVVKVNDSSDARGAFVVMGCNGKLVVGTHRHSKIGGVAVDDPWVVGTKFWVTPMIMCVPRGKAADLCRIEAEVLSVVSNQDEDIMWLFTNVVGGLVPPKKWAMPKAAQTATIFTLKFFQADGVDMYEWQWTAGPIMRTTDTAVYYKATTEDGNCGYPVYGPTGDVAAMHLWGNVFYNGTLSSNGGAFSRPPPVPKVGTTLLPEFLPVPSSQGRVAREGKLEFVVDPARRRYVDQFMIRGLRKDKDLRGLVPKHHMMKCGTAESLVELSKFADELEYSLDHNVFKVAVAAALLHDATGGASVPFIEPDADRIRAVLEVMDLQRSAGSTGGGLTAAAYISELGEGDMCVGKGVVIQRTIQLYLAMLGDPKSDASILKDMFFWNVINKKDGYKQKKIPPQGSGRTIQAPAFELKLLWLTLFGESDDKWMSTNGADNDGYVHQGEDADLPCTGHVQHVLATAVGAYASDVTAWDRHCTPEFLNAFFNVYMRFAVPGVPPAVLSWLYKLTTYSMLVCSDGSVACKTKGNPSGFMNTLRLNCVVHLIALYYVLSRRTGITNAQELVDWVSTHIVIQVCGDDSRLFALTEEGARILDLDHGAQEYLRVWNDELPWTVKTEGIVLFRGKSFVERVYSCPSIVSRAFVWIGGVLWEPLVNCSRVLKRLSCAEERSEEVEESLEASGFGTLALQVYWQMHGWYWNSAVEYLIREYGAEKRLHFVDARVERLYRHVESRRNKPRPSRPVRLWA